MICCGNYMPTTTYIIARAAMVTLNAPGKNTSQSFVREDGSARRNSSNYQTRNSRLTACVSASVSATRDLPRKNQASRTTKPTRAIYDLLAPCRSGQERLVCRQVTFAGFIPTTPGVFLIRVAINGRATRRGENSDAGRERG